MLVRLVTLELIPIPLALMHAMFALLEPGLAPEILIAPHVLLELGPM